MATAAASRLYSTLANYHKVSREGDVTEAVASLERVIVAAHRRAGLVHVRLVFSRKLLPSLLP
jgi:hypothetical protein